MPPWKFDKNIPAPSILHVLHITYIAKYTIHENMITHVQSFSVLYETQQKITVCCIWHCSWVAVGTFCREGVLDIIKILLYLL